MDCHECANWKYEALTYAELVNQWESFIGGTLTPGFLKKYKKEAERQSIPFEEVRIRYKYCSQGILTRFYLMRHENDYKAKKRVEKCKSFSGSGKDMELNRTSLIWRVCTVETHGPSEVKNIKFVPGLNENHTYMRIPMYEYHE